MRREPTIVDLFCGCGGFGLGAELAGFKTIAAIDFDETLQSAYRLNFPKTKVIKADLSIVSENDWLDFIGKKDVDGVIGGPPCQGYSRIGRNDKADPRRELLMHFFRHINIIQPKFFVMENVEGLLDNGNKQQLKDALETLDKRYSVLEPMVLDASLYGAPTKRKRVILIGFDKSRMHGLSTDLFLPPNVINTVRDAIRDLKDPITQNKDSNDFGWNNYRNLKNISEYAKNMRTPPKKGLGWSYAIESLNIGKCSGHFETIHTPDVQQRFENTPAGKIDSISRAKKLSWNGHCPTLRAGTGSEKGSFQAVRPIHPETGRVITVREAARLQGFPDWFCFHPTKWHSFRMIGNSVSPILSKFILEKIKKALN